MHCKKHTSAVNIKTNPKTMFNVSKGKPLTSNWKIFWEIRPDETMRLAFILGKDFNFLLFLPRQNVSLDVMETIKCRPVGSKNILCIELSDLFDTSTAENKNMFLISTIESKISYDRKQYNFRSSA